MATIAAVVSAVAVVGTSAYSASQAGGGAAGTGRAPNFKTPPEPTYERALRHYTARLLAQGAASVPPSFLDYVASGDTATFNLGDTRMTTPEARGLGEFGPKGEPIPRADPGQKQLTLDQMLYLAHAPKGGFGTTPGIIQAGKEYERLQTLEGKEQTAQRQKREARLTKKLKKTGFGPYV